MLAALGLRVASVNPSFADINLVSTNPEIREVSERQLIASHRARRRPRRGVLGRGDPGPPARTGARPGRGGRRSARPGPGPAAGPGRELGITIALENSPYGYLGRAADLIEIVDRWQSPRLRITYDVANALAIEDPAEGVRRIGDRLALAHVSDTWRGRWAHTSIGQGEVDFAGFARALAETGFTGPTVYELVDGTDPEPRLPADLAALAAAGWAQ